MVAFKCIQYYADFSMIIVRTPLRISFAGGGTDLRSYYQNLTGTSDKNFGAVCSLSINKYVYVTINNLSDYFPHRFRISYSQTELVQEASNIKHPIVRVALDEMDIRGGIDINVMADIPAGTGMGSSSCFTVSMLHALHSFKNRLVSKEDLAKEACRLELDLLKEPIGKQDQYACSFGGVNLIKFFPNEKVSLEPIPVSEELKNELCEHLMLFYVGGNREASQILKDQSKNTSSNMQALDKMRDHALTVSEIFSGKKPLSQLGDVLLEGWELKKNLANGISNSKIDSLVESAIRAGAHGGKLLGAGGTGFLLFFAPPDKHDSIRQALSQLTEVHFKLDDLGSTLLYYGQ